MGGTNGQINQQNDRKISDVLTINVPKSNLGPIPSQNPPPPPPPISGGIPQQNTADVLSAGNQLISRVSAQISGDQMTSIMQGVNSQPNSGHNNINTPRGTSGTSQSGLTINAQNGANSGILNNNLQQLFQ